MGKDGLDILGNVRIKKQYPIIYIKDHKIIRYNKSKHDVKPHLHIRVG